MTSTRKEMMKTLKGPDQFQVKLMAFFDWMMGHTKLLALIVGPLLLLAAIGLGWRYFQEQRKIARLEEVGKIQAVYDEELRAVAKQRDALQKQVEAIDAAAAKSGGSLTAEQTSQKDALQKQMESLKPDHNGSLVKFQEYFSKNPTSTEGWMVGVSAAGILLGQEKIAEARGVLEKVQKESEQKGGDGQSFYQATSRLMLVSIFEEQGDFDKALAEIQALEGMAEKNLLEKEMLAQFELAKARAQIFKGAQEDARKTLNHIIEAYANAPEAQKARSMLALLGQ